LKSPSSSESLVPLTATAADRSTEIFVTDGRLRRIARGVGEVTTEVPPGIYKVRFRAGDTQRDELVEVSPGEDHKLVQGSPVMFESAVPIVNTGTTREYHAGAAESTSHMTPIPRGSGSGLFVFSRDLASQERTMPWTGVSIRRLDGTVLAELGDGDTNREDRYGAVHLEVDPGTYCVRVDTGDVGTYEMFVTTAAEWQTQVFMMSEDFWAGKSRIRRPGLNTASVLMTRGGEGFRPEDEHLRLAELARQGLESGRKVVRKSDLTEMLWAKYQNPMLGIYGAHLMLLENRIDHRQLETVMRNLLSLVGPHPDVLALHLRPGAPTPPADLSFPTPPSLRDSWDLIAKATRRRAGLVPSGSITDRVADELITSRPWLLHRVPVVRSDVDEPVSVAEGNRLLEELIERASSGEGASLVRTIRNQPEEFSPLEQSIASVTIGGTLIKSSMRSAIEGVPEDALPDPGPRVADAIRNVDAPATSIARSAKSLVEKLNRLS
jgi:hypothetical protein